MGKEGTVFLPLMSVRGTRYITTARGDVERALTMMKATNEWYHEHFQTPCSEKLMAEDLKHGIAYWCGRDSELRPILVFRANRIPAAWHKAGSYDKVVRVVTFCFEYFFKYMTIPGAVESFSVLIDLQGLSLTQIPVAALKEMYKSMANHYTVRVTRMYICNMSTFLRGIYAIAKNVITERQNQKLCVVTSKAELLKDFAAHHLEKDFGGTKENIKDSWPFQLSPGPFTAGHKGGLNKKAIPNVHKAFVPEALCCRLWNPDLSPSENTHQEYSQLARTIFEHCGLTPPKDCPCPEEESPAKEPGGEEVKGEGGVEVEVGDNGPGDDGPHVRFSEVEFPPKDGDANFEKDEFCAENCVEEFQVTEDGPAPELALDDAPAPCTCCWMSCHCR